MGGPLLGRSVAAFLLSMIAVSPAAAQRSPVVLSGSGIFGDELLLTGVYNALTVEIQNRTNQPIRGTLQARVTHYAESPLDHRTRVDLPPRGTRRVVIDMFVGDGASVALSFTQGGRQLAGASVYPQYQPASSGIVVMSDPPRLRGQLLDLEMTQPAIGPYGSPRTVTPPVGTVSFDPDTGDPILPTRAVSWSGVGLLVASASDLLRTSAAQRSAIDDWLRSGGQMLIFAGLAGALEDPYIVSLLGRVSPISGGATPDHSQLVPDGSRGTYYSGEPPFRTEAFGGSRRLGFGRVYLASYDGMTPPNVTEPETRRLVSSILQTPRVAGSEVPLMPLGVGVDTMDDRWFGSGPSFGALRAALDPNEGYKPALGLVAFVLLFYVILVGPINFTFVGRRNRPTLALITTPVAAISCLVLMLGVGYVGKGTRMRYRAVDIVEVREGDHEGVGRRYTGLFLTRPASFDLESVDRGATRLVRGATADISPVTDHGGERPTLLDMRGGLWETVFVREERVVDNGGPILFEREGQRLAGVQNQSGSWLRGAMIVDGSGGVYLIGDVAPGARASISPSSEFSISLGSHFGSGEDPSLVRLAEAMSLPEDQIRVVEGVLKVMSGSPSGGSVPVLFAWNEVSERPEVAGTFGAEFDLRFIRVVPDLGERSYELRQPGGSAPQDFNLEDLLLENQP
ncbi:MAG: hypothetical protein AAGF12_15400 [Myxococcota bacterium]